MMMDWGGIMHASRLFGQHGDGGLKELGLPRGILAQGLPHTGAVRKRVCAVDIR